VFLDLPNEYSQAKLKSSGDSGLLDPVNYGKDVGEGTDMKRHFGGWRETQVSP
jgi:hypothetical protein